MFKHLLKAYKDKIPGGLADKKQPSEFDQQALKEGIKVELEHTSDQAIAREIAMDHLTEDKEYYKKLATIENKKMEKGAMRRLAPFKPTNLSMDTRESMEEWQEEQPQNARDNLATEGMDRNARKRALHKLTGATKTRLTEDGRREFLLHRGMSHDEYRYNQHPKYPGHINHNDASSWTPDYSVAGDFKKIYNGQTSDGGGGAKRSGIVSAWVHENNIKFVPKQYGYMDPNDDDQKASENKFASEHEIIVEGGHNSKMVRKDQLPALLGHDKAGKIAPTNIDQQITARHTEHIPDDKAFTRQYAARRRPIVKSDPMGMNSAMGKSNYGPKGMGQYNQADNVRRKQSNASENPAIGSIKVKTGANASGGQGKQKLNQEMKQLASKNRKQPVKTFSADEIAQLNAARGLKKNDFKGWTPKKKVHPKDPVLNQKNPPQPPNPKWNDKAKAYFDQKEKLKKDENQSLGNHIIFSAENSPYPDKIKYKMSHEQVLAKLKAHGEDVREVQGHYGSPERSIMVFNPKNSEGIKRVAHSLGQESIIHSDGQNHKMEYLHGPQAGKVVTGKGTTWHQEKPKDFYTTLNGKHFTHNFDFGNE